ncbi:MAG TPA: ABC transporter permease [Terriglobales bacterium]|nr:ABC transporter permease [Terriglobales bacterium]
MFARLLYESFRRQRRRKLLAGLSVTLGVAVMTAMIAVATAVGDKINRELRQYGANLVVYPHEDTLDVDVGGVNLKPASEGAYLSEADLPKIKGIFWRHNVLGFAPFLPVTARLETAAGAREVELLGTYFSKTLTYGKDQFTTGVRTTHPWWSVRGFWPADDSQDVLVGERLAAALRVNAGSTVRLDGRDVRVAGLLSTGDAQEDTVVAPLALAQQIARRPGAVRRVFVSALTSPEDAFARRDPASMTPADRDRWYCTPYALSIAYQLREVIGQSDAEPIRQVAQNEGKVLERIRSLMLLVALAALVASALAVFAAMATALLERRREVGLMRALGARSASVAALFIAEACLLALIGGTAGFLLGMALARQIGVAVFASQISMQPLLFPAVLLLAVLITLAGSAAAIRRALRFDPAVVLRGDL